MIGYFKDHLQTIDGIALYPVLALLIFVLFFAALLYWVFSYNTQELIALKNIPLETQSTDKL
jgi:cytochrome c oxidase cbb3-type subunit 4